MFSYVGSSWVSRVLKNYELGLARLAGFSKVMNWIKLVSWVLKNYELGLAGFSGFLIYCYNWKRIRWVLKS